MNSFTTGYWGEGNNDCITEHGITHHYATYNPLSNIIIDGIDDESAWNAPDVYEYTIPMSNERSSPYFFVSYMYVKYIYDNSNLYIRAIWNDTSLDIHDMALFCWNINCSNYSSLMFAETNAMRTTSPGERVDSWQFVSNFRANGSTNFLLDASFDDEGWLPDDNREVIFGFTYGTWRDGQSNHYQLEMRRSLITNEPDYDVSFIENTPVRFSTGVCNAMENQEHAISWTYDLNLTTNPQPDTYVPIQRPPISTTSSDEPENQIEGYSVSIMISGVLAINIIMIKSKKRKRLIQ
jgi:hypothetical protein